MIKTFLEKINRQEKKIIDYIVKKLDNNVKKKRRKTDSGTGSKEPGTGNKEPGPGNKEPGSKKTPGSGKSKKKKIKVNTEVQVNAIVKSIKQNYIFYLALIICIFLFTKCDYKHSNFFLSVLTLFFITFYGYLVHMVSHHMGTKISELYKTYDNIFTRNKYLNWFAITLIDFGEFHAKTHHDTDINKSYKNIGLEFINNIVSQGGLLIIVKYLLDLLDIRVILLWAFFYASVHNINYNIISPLTHRQHHMNDRTNYGIDIWDIIIGSKYEWDTIETHNHTAINLLVITAVILFFTRKYKL